MESPEGHKLSLRQDIEKPNVVVIRMIYSSESDVSLNDVEKFFHSRGFKTKKIKGCF
jgi:hypothetical protein